MFCGDYCKLKNNFKIPMINRKPKIYVEKK